MSNLKNMEGGGDAKIGSSKQYLHGYLDVRFQFANSVVEREAAEH